MRCYWRLLIIFYKTPVKTGEVQSRIQEATGEHGNLLPMVNKRKPHLKIVWHNEANSAGDKKERMIEKDIGGQHLKIRMGFGDFWGSVRERKAAGGREKWKGIVETSSTVPFMRLRLLKLKQLIIHKIWCFLIPKQRSDKHLFKMQVNKAR